MKVASLGTNPDAEFYTVIRWQIISQRKLHCFGKKSPLTIVSTLAMERSVLWYYSFLTPD